MHSRAWTTTMQLWYWSLHAGSAQEKREISQLSVKKGAENSKKISPFLRRRTYLSRLDMAVCCILLGFRGSKLDRRARSAWRCRWDSAPRARGSLRCRSANTEERDGTFGVTMHICPSGSTPAWNGHRILVPFLSWFNCILEANGRQWKWISYYYAMFWIEFVGCEINYVFRMMPRSLIISAATGF